MGKGKRVRELALPKQVARERQQQEAEEMQRLAAMHALAEQHSASVTRAAVALFPALLEHHRATCPAGGSVNVPATAIEAVTIADAIVKEADGKLPPGLSYADEDGGGDHVVLA